LVGVPATHLSAASLSYRDARHWCDRQRLIAVRSARGLVRNLTPGQLSYPLAVAYDGTLALSQRFQTPGSGIGELTPVNVRSPRCAYSKGSERCQPGATDGVAAGSPAKVPGEMTGAQSPHPH